MSAIFSDNVIVLKEFLDVQDFNQELSKPDNIKKVSIIDLETTGLNTKQDEIIEIAYNIVEFDSSGNFYNIVKRYNSYNDIDGDIPEAITKITGITKEDLKDKVIDWAQVENDIKDVDVICSFNAKFERQFLERYSDIFLNKFFVCAFNEIDYINLVGFKGPQELIIKNVLEVYYDAHAAMTDVNALTYLLSSKVPNKNKTFFYEMMVTSTSVCNRVMCEIAFKDKDKVKDREYLWEPNYKYWYKDVKDSELNDEIQFLESLKANIKTSKINGLTRYK